MLLQTTPLANVEAKGSDALQAFHALSNDPQLEVLPHTGGIAPGWYLLSVPLDAEIGSISMPCLYPDFGFGFSEATRIPLWHHHETSRLECVIMLAQPVKRLRLDPSAKRCDFSVGNVSLKRLNRLDACLRMMKAISQHEDADSKRQTVGSQLRDMLEAYMSGSVSEAGDALRRRYQSLFRTDYGDYRRWQRLFQNHAGESFTQMREEALALEYRPLISILMPTYNTPGQWLIAALDSVISQAYENWELCIADDASTKKEVTDILRRYADADPRIRCVFRQSNGHISEASNSALELATGEYCALLDHDDELAPHALLEVAKALNRNRHWQVVYSDEDKIDEQGRRFDPYFKSEWNRELMLGQNCVCHLGVYRTDLLRRIGGFRKGFEGAQDWDLSLRAIDAAPEDAIGHVPEVLYHWRAISGSTALGVQEKTYATTAGQRAVEEHIQRIGQPATVEQTSTGFLRVRNEVPAPQPLVSLIIPTRDKAELLRQAVQSILEKTSYSNYEILIVDNGSVEKSTLQFFSSLADEPRVRVLPYDYPFNYSAINNHAAQEARGEILGLINNDIEVITPEWLSEMVSIAIQPDVGVVGAMLYYPDDTIQHAGVLLGIGGVAGHAFVGEERGSHGYFSRASLTQEISAVTAACLLVRRSVYEKVGGLDTGLKVAFNDVDFCLRVREHGFRNIWTPFAELYHHESASRGYEDTPEKQARFQQEVAFMHRRWGTILERDPFYNPNLSLDTAFQLAFPPRHRDNPEFTKRKQ